MQERAIRMRATSDALEAHADSRRTCSIHACMQVCSARTRQRFIHTAIFVSIQVLLNCYAVSSLFTLALSYAAVRLAASRPSAVHSSSCRVATSIAVFFGAAFASSFVCGLVGMLLVLVAPRSFLWWSPQVERADEDAAAYEDSGEELHSREQDDEDGSLVDISDTEPADFGSNALLPHFGTQFKLEEPGAQKSGHAGTSCTHGTAH